MSALYEMQYGGVSGTGHGAVYVGRGRILGVDITGGRYEGSYTEAEGQLRGTVTLHASGALLVTGQPAPAGHRLAIRFDLPVDFGDGSFRTVWVGQQEARVAFRKVGEIP